MSRIWAYSRRIFSRSSFSPSNCSKALCSSLSRHGAECMRITAIERQAAKLGIKPQIGILRVDLAVTREAVEPIEDVAPEQDAPLLLEV